ncbi:dynein-related subfamily AAA family protein [Tenacibaculum skagerrakense]|uniref:Dynein-related subfamily AAA family protein n=1 Tax=Tenacibaculum skagerrakense TaxID=186571 RepID=A0A4R2NZ11_9FLAO|nr:DNA repair ATPase [Tenacibaculum skagerrakense]TCP26978.1 dynein-related subfamily AAA family protein [Tenacibaculum skagerrakense]
MENQNNQQLDGGTYEIIQGRLQKQKQELQDRLHKLNDARKHVFGTIETKLIANDRINTENNCIARDIVSFGNTSIFGYNVHFGLRTDIKLSDVFSVYEFKENHFHLQTLDLIHDDVFINDFTNLYKYYRKTIFSKFAIVGNYLHMVFQLSENTNDIKTFKWLINDNSLQYVDNRSEHEYKFPTQHEFQWQEVTRDMHRYGVHSHISVLDKVFVETIGGDLTIKIEDNTDDGKGILSEPVEHIDQTLDDGQFRYGDLGNLTTLEIKPFQEAPRYFVYNHKLQEVQRIDSIKDTAVQLPDGHGIIFPNGYYLQTGEHKIFESDVKEVKFQKKISSPNGEDFLYVFYATIRGLYILMSYNIIEQEVKTPIICNGFTLLENGELCYFRTENEQTKHHVVQIWQTPYLKGSFMPSQHTDSLLYKIGNKDIVKAMAECHELINLLNKEDNYTGLYNDIAKISKDINDTYYWLPEEETHQLNEPIRQINEAANAAIEEFEKVVQLKKQAEKATQEINKKSDELFSKIRSTSFKSIDDFVGLLSQLRSLRGEVISLHDVRYIQKEHLEALEEQVAEQNNLISKRCVQFLLNDKALAPYHQRVSEKEKALPEIKKVVDAKALEKEVNQITADLEMLIDIVSNLEIEDTSQSTKIIDNISLIFATLNQLKAGIKNKIKSLGSSEAKADFVAQLKLIDQSIINYIDMATTPDKCDEFLTKTAIQLEELEGKFADFEEFIGQIIEKREEIHAAFDARKNNLIEKRNKKAVALQTASERILKGIAKKAQSFDSVEDINGYFAADLMINKVRDIVNQLKELDDAGKAEAIETQLKVAKEDALRKLKDKQELYEDGENIIKLGKHKFGVNKQALDLTIVYKNEELYYHLTGTDFYDTIDNKVLLQSKKYWNQELVSENTDVYRAAYLAYKIFKSKPETELLNKTVEQLLEVVQKESSNLYSEGYVKGVHDVDASQILHTLVHKHHELGLLTFSPTIRAYAQYFWNSLEEEQQTVLNSNIKASGEVLSVFPNSESYSFIIDSLSETISVFADNSKLFKSELSTQIAYYLFDELKANNTFQLSADAVSLKEDFIKTLKKQDAYHKFRSGIDKIESYTNKINLAKQWVSSFLSSKKKEAIVYIDEIVCISLFQNESKTEIKAVHPIEKIENLKGDHNSINEGIYEFNYHEFIQKHEHFVSVEVPNYIQYKEAKQEVTEQLKEDLKLEEFKPRVLSSFVRNKLIDQVYFPLIGDNLAKQLGTVGDNKRTDRMGMLLLISPPGYGKTTLMEYISNRLGLVFMKINGPAIGHDVTSVDPMSANNSASREELKKLNLAFEMGDNVMLYLDDIQHCNPEFLQKFISLSDGTRKVEGVFNGKPKTYDLRGKKFSVIMAGNPYTESGDRFQIPDMLANRADIYNLGDIIGDTAHLFKLSLIENSLTSNPVLHQLSSKYFEDVYSLIDKVENNTGDVDLKGNHTKQEIQDYTSVLEKVITVRDTVLKVNQAYIQSAAMEDQYRTEPSFKLQGSYRDMNKLVAKIVPIMNNDELQRLLLSHYESESQTLTSAAEGNLLKYKELINKLSEEESARWNSIKEIFLKNNKLKGFGDKNEMAQILSQMMAFSENLEGIKEALQKGLEK